MGGGGGGGGECDGDELGGGGCAGGGGGGGGAVRVGDGSIVERRFSLSGASEAIREKSLTTWWKVSSSPLPTSASLICSFSRPTRSL